MEVERDVITRSKFKNRVLFKNSIKIQVVPPGGRGAEQKSCYYSDVRIIFYKRIFTKIIFGRLT